PGRQQQVRGGRGDHVVGRAPGVLFEIDELHDGLSLNQPVQPAWAGAVARRTALAEGLDGSRPRRLTVSMHSSVVWRRPGEVAITAPMPSAPSSAENDGPITLPGTEAPLIVEPSEPPSDTWYHSLPSLSTPRMPMCPVWWWPHEFMQPLICRSISPM